MAESEDELSDFLDKGGGLASTAKSRGCPKCEKLERALAAAERLVADHEAMTQQVWIEKGIDSLQIQLGEQYARADAAEAKLAAAEHARDVALGESAKDCCQAEALASELSRAKEVIAELVRLKDYKGWICATGSQILAEGREEMSKWIAVNERLPDEHVPVLTKSAQGNEQHLTRQGHLWFFPDMSMYVYYTPTHWKPL